MGKSKHEGWSMAPFLALLACAALFVLASTRYLPPVVASHFGAAGQANGFMPRSAYVLVMLVVSVLAPLFITVVPLRAFRRPDVRINLPNSQYWLAAERCEATLDYLSRQVVRFASMLTLFLCYVQWLVVVANRVVPPKLPMQLLVVGLVVYLASTLIWLVAFRRHFRKASREGVERTTEP